MKRSFSTRWGHRGRPMSTRQEENDHQKMTQPAPWSGTSQPPELWDKKFCYSHCTACGTWLRQLKKTKTPRNKVLASDVWAEMPGVTSGLCSHRERTHFPLPFLFLISRTLFLVVVRDRRSLRSGPYFRAGWATPRTGPGAQNHGSSPWFCTIHARTTLHERKPKSSHLSHCYFGPFASWAESIS